MNNNVESNTTTTNVVGTRHKKFSIKRWVKKTWAKQKQQQQQRRAADANQLNRTQRQEGTKKSDEEAIGGSGPEVADRSHPLRKDNNNHDEGTSMHDDDLNPHDNQMDVVQRQISHAGPYTESITIENPLCTNKTSQPSRDKPSAAPQHHHDVDAAPTAVAVSAYLPPCPPVRCL
ncbi:hypothetical protein DYB38_002302 [Aphanomyces astaci]|uniref:Uncharacterized protein n=1 Tax=Aphanomyces astaci TaxID=112090 RepID=A0A397CAX5_APHAT|nr:hypothetical protein DYB38_002302 [Aphanomyces astaci]